MTGNCQVRFLEDGVGSNPTLLFDVRRERYTMDCGSIRHSIHSERPYSDVHFWQRICAKLRGQRGVKTEPDSSKSLGKWTYGEPKGEDPQGS
jgi:hypothetical protein